MRNTHDNAVDILRLGWGHQKVQNKKRLQPSVLTLGRILGRSIGHLHVRSLTLGLDVRPEGAITFGRHCAADETQMQETVPKMTVELTHS